MDSPVERSVDELIAEAEQTAQGRISPGQFVATLDWSLPRISQRGGDYAPQGSGLIADALDRLGAGGVELSAEGARALAAAAAVIGREGHRPDSVARVHGLLVAGGLAPAGPPPAPRPRSVVHARAPTGGGAMKPDQPAEVDPALDPEIARAAARIAPGRSTYQSLGMLGLGWAIVICVVGGFLGGLWLDGRFGSSPLLTGVGTVVGLGLAYLVFREMLRQSRA